MSLVQPLQIGRQRPALGVNYRPDFHFPTRLSVEPAIGADIFLAPYRATRLYVCGAKPAGRGITSCGTEPPPARCGGEPGSFRAATHCWFVVVSCLTGARSSSPSDPHASSSDRRAAIAGVAGLRRLRLWF